MWAIFKPVPYYSGAFNFVETVAEVAEIEEELRNRVLQLKCGHLVAFEIRDEAVKIPPFLIIQRDSLPDWATDKIVYEVSFA